MMATFMLMRLLEMVLNYPLQTKNLVTQKIFIIKTP